MHHDDEKDWARFSRVFALTFGSVLAFIIAFITLFDPYHNIPFSPPITRHFMDNNERFLFPSLARDEAFDSAIIGTSSARLLSSDILDPGLRTRFANLTLSAGRPYEQAALAKLFLDHHEAPSTILWGIDQIWCYADGTKPQAPERQFPNWMHDNNPYNDLLYLLNGKSLEIASRQLRYYFGLDILRYQQNGYDYFLPPQSEYDITKARMNIYNSESPKKFTPTKWDGKTRRYDSLALFQEIVERMPDETRLVIVYPPHHAYFYNRNIQRLESCKSAFSTLAQRAHKNTRIIDFMIDSPLTRSDETYWDPLHYNAAAADRLSNMIVDTVNSEPLSPDDQEIVR